MRVPKRDNTSIRVECSAVSFCVSVFVRISPKRHHNGCPLETSPGYSSPDRLLAS